MPSRRFVRSTNRVTLLTTLSLGAISGLFVALALFLVRLFHITGFSNELWFAQIFLNRDDEFAWRFGFTFFVISSAVVAVFYSMIFRSAHRSGAAIGVQLSFYHYLIAGAAASFTDVGPFFMNRDLAQALCFLFSHFLYGAILGTLFDRASIEHVYALPLNAEPEAVRSLQ